MPLGHFGTNRAIMLTNTRNIKTNAPWARVATGTKQGAASQRQMSSFKIFVKKSKKM